MAGRVEGGGRHVGGGDGGGGGADGGHRVPVGRVRGGGAAGGYVLPGREARPAADRGDEVGVSGVRARGEAALLHGADRPGGRGRPGDGGGGDRGLNAGNVAGAEAAGGDERCDVPAV